MPRNVPHPAQNANPSPWLADIAPEHACWDTKKANADGIAGLYTTDPKLERYAQRVHDCAESLLLSEHATEQGKAMKAHAALCHVRHCPICQVARAVRLGRAIKAGAERIEAADEKHKAYRWLFLTLSVKNPPIIELRPSLATMNKGWKRFTECKEFSIVKGWLRTTEVTRGAWIDTRSGEEIDKRQLESVPRQHRRPKDPTLCHPHFHALLLVPPSYFKSGAYLKHEKWVSLWQKAMRLDYAPSVDIQAVKTLDKGITEVVKAASYSVKPDEVADEAEWFCELHRQTQHLRFVALGGLLKEHIRLDETPEQDDDPATETGRKILFDWQRPVKHYRKRSEKPA